MMPRRPLTVKPIGYVQRAETQGREVDELRRAPAAIVVYPELTAGLEGIECCSRLVVIFYCHEVRGSPLRVHPRRDPHRQPRGVFASRSPARPNPLGLTVISLLRVEGNVLHVCGLDAVNGTPVLDIKPFDPVFDGAEDA
jgi:tRNA-Thr(GGU) m(6)t(6)A37 methyltransferase TsaA